MLFWETVGFISPTSVKVRIKSTDGLMSETDDGIQLFNVVESGDTTQLVYNEFRWSLGFGQRNYNYDEFVHLTLYKNGSALTTATGDADGSTSRITAACDVDFNWGTSPLPFHILDTAGATSEQTYTFALSSGGDSAVTVYLNRGYHTTDASWNSRTISTITAMEIAV